MPPRSAEEKERRRKLREEKLAAKKAAKLEKEAAEEAEGKKKKSSTTTTTTTTTTESSSSSGPSPFVSMPEDAIRHLFCFLPSRELGATIMTCTTFNRYMGESRVMHLLSRLNQPYKLRQQHNDNDDDDNFFDGDIRCSIQLCQNEADVRKIISDSLTKGGDTGRLITKKSKKAHKHGDADEYVSYARFVEEALCGYSIQSTGNKLKPTFLPPKVNGKFVSVSPEHTICRQGGGSFSGAGGSGVSSWGVGKRGQLGHGKRKDEQKPRPIIGGIGQSVRIVQVSAGGGLVRVAHTLLLTSTGRVLSFGTAQYGQLGHGYSAGKQLSDELRPKYIEALNGVRCTCVSAGELHSAVVTTDGDVYSWGDGFCGQLGLGDKRPQLLPRQVTLGGLEDECVLSVSCGNRHTLAVTEEGEVFSFGLGHFGVLGRSYTPFEYDADAAIVAMGPDMAAPPPPVVAMAEDNNGAAAAAAEDGMPREGPNGISEQMMQHLDLLANLTLDDGSDQCIPKVIDSLQGIKIVCASSGHRHSMVLDENGSVYTFGSGLCGALGHGDNLKQEYPVKVLEFENSNVKIMQISVGVDISMAVSTEGNVYAWGKAAGGRIGLGVAENEVTIPRRVTLPGKEDFKAIDVECGYVHSAIVSIDGTLHICGGVGVDGEDDGQTNDHSVNEEEKGKPRLVKDFNIWHRIPEAKEEKVVTKWKKYGKYELKGRSAMMKETEKWGN